MKSKSSPARSDAKPSENDVRDYAYHLFLQNGGIPGRDAEDWLEAEACLCANIPREHSRTRLHRHLAAPIAPVSLVASIDAQNVVV